MKLPSCHTFGEVPKQVRKVSNPAITLYDRAIRVPRYNGNAFAMGNRRKHFQSYPEGKVALGQRHFFALDDKLCPAGPSMRNRTGSPELRTISNYEVVSLPTLATGLLR
jgi:hypothetical protein